MSSLLVDEKKKTKLTVTSHNALYDLVLIPIILSYLFCLWSQEVYGMNLILILLFAFCTYVQLKEKRYGNLFFYATFFLFLLDTVFFGLFKSEYKYHFLNTDSEVYVLNCLTISIVGVYFGSIAKGRFRLSINRKRKLIETDCADVDYSVSKKMQSFLRLAYIVCAQFSLLNAFVKAVFVQSNSYVAYYSEFETPLPYIVIWLSTVAPLLFYFYLGTMPEKKKVILPCSIYLLVGVVALFYGQRNVFVIRAIVILCYFLIRNRNASNGEQWITKRQIAILIASIPAAIIFMGFWGEFRFDREYQDATIIDRIINALLEQGNDISILDYEYRYSSYLPDKPYAIGGIITFLSNNIYARLIGIPAIPAKGNTVETALYGYSFSSALMYHENRTGYLMGFGIGSCYIAELVHSFGYLGIFCGSVIYGVVLKWLSQVKLRGFIANGFAMAMFQQLLMAPRSTYDGFIAVVFQVANLFVALICWFLSTRVWPRGNNG